MSTLVAGTVVDGRFEVRSTLGRGSYATVYKAWQTGLSRTVALKVIEPEVLCDEEAQIRFRHEAEILCSLHDEGIAAFYAYGLHEGQTFIAMEYVEGQPLSSLQAEVQRFDPQEALSLFTAIVRAVDVAHRAGVIHRDIKPENIVISERAASKIKLIDFGLARSSNQAMQRLTQPGVAVGTVLFMSPEQCLAKPADARTDIYQLGCVLYLMLVGRPPFLSANSALLMRKHVTEKPPVVSEIIPSIPEELSRLVSRMLEKAPEARFENAGELLQAVENLRKEYGKLRTRTAKPAVVPFLIPCVACLIIISSIMMGFFWNRWQHAPGGTKAMPPEAINEDELSAEAFKQLNSNPAKAQELYSRVVEYETKRFGHANSGSVVALCNAYDIQGKAREIIALAEKQTPNFSDAHEKAAFLLVYGKALLGTGKNDRARAVLSQALSLCGSEWSKSRTGVLSAWLLADTYNHQDQLNKAEVLLDQLEKQVDARGYKDMMLGARVEGARAYICMQRGQKVAAVEHAQEAYGFALNAHDEEDICRTAGSFATLLYNSGKRSEALQVLRDCLQKRIVKSDQRQALEKLSKQLKGEGAPDQSETSSQPLTAGH